MFTMRSYASVVKDLGKIWMWQQRHQMHDDIQLRWAVWLYCRFSGSTRTVRRCWPATTALRLTTWSMRSSTAIRSMTFSGVRVETWRHTCSSFAVWCWLTPARTHVRSTSRRLTFIRPRTAYSSSSVRSQSSCLVVLTLCQRVWIAQLSHSAKPLELWFYLSFLCLPDLLMLFGCFISVCDESWSILIIDWLLCARCSFNAHTDLNKAMSLDEKLALSSIISYHIAQEKMTKACSLMLMLKKSRSSYVCGWTSLWKLSLHYALVTLNQLPPAN